MKEVKLNVESDMTELTFFLESLTDLIEGRIEAFDFVERFTHIDVNQTPTGLTVKGRVGIK